jgi:MinD superfamily P-loop ATPase
VSLVLSVASGKGGTGKTVVSTSLAWVAALEREVLFLDCDVEDPDAHFYLKPEWKEEKEVLVTVPQVDSERCDGCGACAEFCRFNALAVIKDDVLVFPELCHGCGGCALACTFKCISETERRIGIVRTGSSGRIAFRQGLLDIGEPMCLPVIRVLRSGISENGLTIVDCPPGTGCPMVASIEGSDYCVLVTEPSPFGRHDLDLAHRVASDLGIPHGVVINKDTGGSPIIEDYCSSEGIEVLGRIPYTRDIAELCSRGEVLSETRCEWRSEFFKILRAVKEACQSSLLS